MYNEEEIEDSLAFCRDIKKYYENQTTNYVNINPHPINTVSYPNIIYKETTTKEIEIKPSMLTIFLKEAVHLLLCLGIAYLVSQLIIQYVGQHTKVEGYSMEDTLHNNDVLIIDKVSFHFSNPTRYDIIVFPHDNDYYIKRIIGLPSEEVEIINGYIYINGEKISDEYEKEVMREDADDMDKIILGKDEYFVLGDNRNNSYDSRYPEIGNIKRSEIIGKAWFRIYPFEAIGFIKHQ